MKNKIIKEKIKNQNIGITLIALVITIIVLLILAGVTIATLTGDNGLLQKAGEAKEKNEEAKELEQLKLAVSSAIINGRGHLTTENLNAELQKQFNDEKTVTEGIECWHYKRKRIYEIDKNGKVEVVSFNINMEANIKSIELEKIILDLKIISNISIDDISIKDSYSNNILKINNIDNEKYTSELDAQINIEYNIMVKTEEGYYVATIKVDSEYLGGTNVTINESTEKYYGYGANDKYFYRKLSGNQTISDATFGDPCHGISKSSYSIGNSILVYNQQLLKDNKEYLKEMTENVLSIDRYEEGSFYVSLSGSGMENIKNINVYKSGNNIFSTEINDNKFSTNLIFNNNEEYIFEIVYSDNNIYNRTIKLNKSENCEERLLGGARTRVDTGGKWYFIKFGVDERWKYKWIFGENVIIDSDIVGGDPAPGVSKKAYLIDIAEVYDKIIMK